MLLLQTLFLVTENVLTHMPHFSPGAANIMDKNAAAPRTDADVVPPEATRPSTENKDYHVGRGGAGNEHLAPGHDKKLAEAADKAGKGGNVGLADKLKAKVTGIFKK